MQIRTIYLLQSLLHPSQNYVGVTSDLEVRLADHNADHNAGRSRHTAKFAPWKLVVAVQCSLTSEKPMRSSVI